MPEKIGFVGVGRMGANMARRLKEVAILIAAVYDVRKTLRDKSPPKSQGGLRQLACDRASTSSSSLVVTDDDAMRNIFSARMITCSKTPRARVHQLCRDHLAVHIEVEKPRESRWCRLSPRGVHGLSITQARNGLPLPHDRGARRRLREGQVAPGKVVASMRCMSERREGRRGGQGAGQHGHEYHYGRTLPRDSDWGRAGPSISTCCARFSRKTGAANSRVLETDGGYAESRTPVRIFQPEHAAKDPDRTIAQNGSKLDLLLATATFDQYTAMTLDRALAAR